MLDDGGSDIMDLVSQGQTPSKEHDKAQDDESDLLALEPLEPLTPYPRPNEWAVLGIGAGVAVGVFGLLVMLAKAKTA